MKKELIRKGSVGLDSEDLYGYGFKQAGMSPEFSETDESVPDISSIGPEESIVDTQVKIPSNTASGNNDEVTKSTPGGTEEQHRYVLNGRKLNIVYDSSLSARKNRKLLKEHLEANGLGDKADATGLVGEYLNTKLADDLYSVNKKDKKWLEGRSKQYGYTVDNKGNREYYRRQNPLLRGVATIAGGLIMGPTGAFIGNLLTKKPDPTGAQRGFWSTNRQTDEKTNQETEDVTQKTPIITDYNKVLKDSVVQEDGSFIKGNTRFWIGQNGLTYRQDLKNGLHAYGTAGTDGTMNYQGIGRYDDQNKFTPVQGMKYNNINYTWDPDSSSFKGTNSAGQTVYTVFNNGQWKQNNDAIENYTFYRKGGIMNKFQQGGTIDQQEQALLYATLGMMGYAESQGTELDFESALTQVMEVSQSQPEAIQQIIQNKEFIQAGAKSLQTKDPNLFKQLQQPGTLKKIVSQLSQKAPVKQQKTKKAMKGTKLDYIKELKGICPEGFEITYQAMGGHICPVCKQKKVEEAKCGKKMKKHEDGGKSKGGVSPVVNKTVDEMKKKPAPYVDKDGNEFNFATKQDSIDYRKLTKKPLKTLTSAERKRLSELNKFQTTANLD